jgi:integrase
MGSPRVTAAEPERSAWENRSRLDRSAMAPQSVVPIADFVENVFVPEHVAMKGLSGRTHYQAILKHVLTPEEVVRVFHVDAGKSKTRLKAVPNWPYLGGVRLCDVRPDDIQRLISAALAQGYSTQTVKHIRNVVSAIFAHARKKLWFNGDNPASLVTLPEMTRKEPHALTLAQANELLGVMQYPEKEMTILAILTSMNIAEICGLQWKHVNLTESWSHTDGKPIPPKTIAVRKEWYRGELSRVQQKSRNRDLSIPEPLLSILSGLSRRPRFTGPEDFVLVSNAGTPVNEKNIAARRLKSIGKDLQMPWLSWHALRRTHATLAYELGMQFMKTGLSGGSSTTHEEGLGGRLTMSGS